MLGLIKNIYNFIKNKLWPSIKNYFWIVVSKITGYMSGATVNTTITIDGMKKLTITDHRFAKIFSNWWLPHLDELEVKYKVSMNKGSIEKIISSATKLKKISFDSNDTRTIINIPELKELEELFLGYAHSFETLIQFLSKASSSLKKLSLYRIISGGLSFSLSDLSNLPELKNLQELCLCGAIDPEILSQIMYKSAKSLKKLKLHPCRNSFDCLNLDDLPLLSNLEELYIETKISARALEKILSCAPGLKKITLKCYRLRDIYVPSLTQIEELDIRCSMMLPATISQLICSSEKLKKLTLHDHCWNVQNLGFLNLDGLPVLNSLEELHIENSNIHAMALAKIIRSSKNIKKINLNCEVSYEKLYSADFDNLPRLNQLEFFGLEFKYDLVHVIASIIKKSPKLKTNKDLLLCCIDAFNKYVPAVGGIGLTLAKGHKEGLFTLTTNEVRSIISKQTKIIIVCKILNDFYANMRDSVMPVSELENYYNDFIKAGMSGMLGMKLIEIIIQSNKKAFMRRNEEAKNDLFNYYTSKFRVADLFTLTCKDNSNLRLPSDTVNLLFNYLGHDSANLIAAVRNPEAENQLALEISPSKASAISASTLRI